MTIDGPAQLAVRDERKERLRWLGVGLGALVGVFVHPVLAFVAFLVLPAVGVKLLLWRFEVASTPTSFVHGEVRALRLEDGGGVVLLEPSKGGDVERRCNAAEVIDGWLEPDPEPAVVLRTRSAIVCVCPGSHARAEAILEACGRSAATNVTRLRIVPATACYPLAGTLAMGVAIVATCVAVFLVPQLLYQAVRGHPLLGAPLDGGAVFVAIAALVALLVAGKATVPRLVEIGRDRVVLHGPFRRSVLPVAEIERIERTRHGLSLRGHGRALALDLAAWHQHVDRMPERFHLRDALFTRVGASCKLEASAPAPARLRVLDPGQRSPEEHRAVLARVAGGEDYRSESLTIPELLATVGARDVARPIRVSAAWALSTTQDAAALDRARATAQSLADEDERDEVLAALDGSVP